MFLNDHRFKNKNCSTNTVYSLLIILILFGAFGKSSAAIPEKVMKKEYKKALSFFIENEGQLSPNVRYYQRGLEQAVYYSRNEVIFVFSNSCKKDNAKSTLRLTMHGMDAKAEISGFGLRNGKINYFIGNEPKNWHEGISTYDGVFYRNVYPNVDIVFHGQNDSLEYDVIAKALGLSLN